MAKYCFKEQDMYCVTEWAIETLDKWKKHGQPKCVDIEKLRFYIVSSSVYTGKYCDYKKSTVIFCVKVCFDIKIINYLNRVDKYAIHHCKYLTKCSIMLLIVIISTIITGK